MHARSCHLIFRRSHWLVPNDLLHGYLLVEYVFSRLFTITYTPYPYAPHSALYPFLHRRCSFILNKIFDSISADTISTVGAIYVMIKIFYPKFLFKIVKITYVSQKNLSN